MWRDLVVGPSGKRCRTRSFGNEDLALAIELAHRAALAIDYVVPACAAGDALPRRSPWQQENVLFRAHEAFLLLVQQAGPTLCVDVPTPLPAVSADPERLLQVLFNLLSNAGRLPPAGGEISLRAGLGETHRPVIFTVKDTGSGISAEDIPKVFTRVWQAKQSAHGGTGLGRAFAKVIVTSHGGVIAVQRVPGHGTTFSFDVPILQP